MDRPAYSNGYVHALQRNRAELEDLLTVVLEAIDELEKRPHYKDAYKFLMSHIPTVECP